MHSCIGVGKDERDKGFSIENLEERREKYVQHYILIFSHPEILEVKKVSNGKLKLLRHKQLQRVGNWEKTRTNLLKHCETAARQCSFNEVLTNTPYETQKRTAPQC